MTHYYTYLYRDPKDGTPIYVGVGKNKRAWDHLTQHTNNRLHNTLKKRISEGYVVEPILSNEVDRFTALRMEEFWINQFGRADLGTGTLFNLTDGGDNPPSALGRKRSDSHRAKVSKAQKGVSDGPLLPEHRKRISDGLLRAYQENPRPREQWLNGAQKRLNGVGYGQNNGRVHKRIVCPHCKFEGGITGMLRWHFDNCRSKQC